MADHLAAVGRAVKLKNIRALIVEFARKDATWVIGVQILSNVIRLVSNVVLTRLVAPEAFGAVSIAVQVVVVATLLSDLGLLNYVLRRKTAEPEFLDFIWTIQALRNGAIALVLLVGADFCASLYGYPELGAAIRVYAMLFWVSSFQSLALITAQRDGQIVKLTLLEFATYLATTGVNLSAAYFLHNYWAIFIGMGASTALTFVWSYLAFPGARRRFRFSGREWAELFAYSRFIVPASIVRVFLSQTDKFVLAKFLSLHELGLYATATGLASAPTGLLGQYVARVFLPAYSAAHRQDPAFGASIYYAWRRRVSMLATLALGGAAGAAPLIADILFTEKYVGVTFYMTFVLLGAVATVSTAAAERALVTRGLSSVFLQGNTARLIWLAASVPLAFHFAGPKGVFLVVCAMETMVTPVLWRLLQREGLFNLRSELLILAPALTGYLLGAGGSAAAEHLKRIGFLPNF